MNPSRRIGLFILFSLFALSVIQIVARQVAGGNSRNLHRATRLYWFIPDGLRAEPDVFKIYEWAKAGELPNIKKMIDNGVYGYSIPVFPSHTPSNFATLFTGVLPKEHGIADGPLRAQGYPLKMITQSGFSSTAKLKDPIWYTLEKNGLVSSLLTIPGSTPPEISQGNIVRGRWGGWGVEFPSVVIHSSQDSHFRQLLGRNERMFNVGKRLTHFVDPEPAKGWSVPLPQVYGAAQEFTFHNWEADVYVLLLDTLDDQKAAHNLAIISLDKKTEVARLGVGEWSRWFELPLQYAIQKSYQDEAPQKMKWEQDITELKMPTQIRIGAIQMGTVKDFRFRVLYDGLNESLTFPSLLNGELHGVAGPMVDFPDDYPPQLIYFENDKKTFLKESQFSFDWHEKALEFLLDKKQQDLVIHNIYTPNQMLTSRWWMGAEDPQSHRYKEANQSEHELVHSEILQMYKRVDDMLGLAMKHMDPDSYIVFSSDHGVAPLNVEVRLNNFFAQKGWLHFYKDKKTGVFMVDWKKTRVVFLQSNHIYINTDNLDMPYSPQKGKAYEFFRQEVLNEVKNLQVDGVHPFAHVYLREDAVEALGLPANLIGDLVLSFELGFCAVEDMSDDRLIYADSLKAGYKQGVLPKENKSLWTPFIVMGPGVKKGVALKEPISHLDQYPTVMTLLKQKIDLPVKNQELRESLPVN